ncbi:MAG: beta-N-acetylhexosaminidase, partial [Muribaculaceae bacterium]|nr:beta-N-acetylhexosaminidase [Muribaculaceae bacterium]
MKHKLLCLALAAFAACGIERNAGVEAWTPLPKQMTVGAGSLVLPQSFNVGYPADLSADMIAEVSKFANALKAATDLNVTANAGQGLITVGTNAALGAEAYNLTVTDAAVSIEASAPAGLYYAFQSVKKLLPAHVVVGAKGTAGEIYSLPVVTINDEPRFEYRGFMLDVSRHFFDAAQVKKMLDIMAVYKLNRFHWHLTDDQGWRLPVAKYPLLTTQGATNHNILHVNFQTDPQERYRVDNANATYDCGDTYGPYAYTIEELKEVVAYAKERHIEVIPEIDMPGHMTAAINCYPNFSTDPESKIALAAGYNKNTQPIPGQQDSHFTHNIWNDGGVSKDVLDITKPEVLTFCKDVIDVLVEVFPYNYIHIGGDECPTYAWSKNDDVQNFKTTIGYNKQSNDRVLQTWFTKQIADYAKQYGKKIMGWNELITAGGSDMNVVKEIDPIIFCWTGGQEQAQNNGLNFVYTPFNGGYYINRAYAGFDKVGAVGDGRLSTTLNVMPPNMSRCIGVQGTFWTEQVERPQDVEYLALPRLIGIAEQGWAQAEGRDNDEVMERICNEAEVLDLAGYSYGAHQLVRPSTFKKPDPNKWYRLSSICSDERADRVIELVTEGSPLITSLSAQVGKIWTNTAVEDNDAQLFRFVEDPNNKDHFAIICKASPAGSINPEPTGTNLSDRWNYNYSTVSYGFELSKDHYFEQPDGSIRYAIRSYGANNKYFNFSKAGQKYAINVYNSPLDGNGGVVNFTAVADYDPNEVPTPPTPPTPGEEFPAQGVYYRLQTRFNGDQSQARYGSAIELMQDASKGNNCQADRLWSNAPAESSAANYEYQLFKFEADPAGTGYYAMICKAKNGGSVNCVPSVSNNSNTARWDYDNDNVHYGFQLVEEYQGTDADGHFYSAITSK